MRGLRRKGKGQNAPEERDKSARPRKVAPLFVIPILQALAPTCAVLTIAGLVVRLVYYAQRGGGNITHELWVLLAGFTVGLGTSAALFGLAVALRYMHSLNSSIRRLEAARRESGGANESASPARQAPNEAAEAAGTGMPRALPYASLLDDRRFEKIMSLLDDIRENSLLSDEQRHAKLKRLAEQKRQDLLGEIESLLHRKEFHRARMVLSELVKKYGQDQQTASLETRIEEARAKAEREEIAAVIKETEDLMSTAAWERARLTAQELLNKYPDLLEARELLERVEREQRLFEQEERNRMRDQIQRHSARREWRRALSVARALLERYPDSIEAEAIRAQMDTLEANAEIEQRHELEAQIKDLVRRHRFREALELARRVIADYPNSPQAEVLRGQIDLLEQRAAEQERQERPSD